MIKHLWTLLNRTAEKASCLQDFVLLGLRLYWGWQFFMTGKGKLMNLEGTTTFFAELGLPLPQMQAVLAGSTECLGGLLLLIGLASRLTAVPLIFTMIVAYLTAHRDVVTGIWADSDAFVTAPPFLFLLAAVLILVFGPGKFSVDALLRRPSAP